MKRRIKRYRPKRRLKINLAIRGKNNILLAFSYTTLIVFILFFIKLNYSKLARIKDLSFTKTTINRIFINPCDSDIQRDIENILSGWINKPYSKQALNEIKDEIKKRYPYLKISSSFNPITGSLTISLSKLSAIARFKNEDLYLLEDLSISNKNPDPEKNYPFIKIEDKKPDFLNLFLKISKTDLLSIINSTPTIYTQGNNVVVEYGDEVRLILPKDFRATKIEVKRIKEVVKDAKRKLGNRFKVDARYISDGKIIVKPE